MWRLMMVSVATIEGDMVPALCLYPCRVAPFRFTLSRPPTPICLLSHICPSLQSPREMPIGMRPALAPVGLFGVTKQTCR